MKLFNLFILVFSLSLKAQINPANYQVSLYSSSCPPSSVKSKKCKKSPLNHKLIISGYGSYGSNNLNNTFINKLVLGGHIDNDLKNKALDKARLFNRLGAELNYGVQYYNLKDTFLQSSPNIRYYFGFGSFTNYSAQYTNDVYETVFYGNAPFVNKPIFTDGTRVFQSDFKKITFGIVNLKHNWKLGLSVVSGNKHELLSIREGDLITKNNGSELVLNVDAIIQQSDSNSNGYLNFSGAGLAIDFEKTFWNTVTFTAENVGFALWNRNPAVRNINSPITFDGFTVDNLDNLNTLKVEDELDSLIPNRESKSFNSFLPAIFTLRKAINPMQKWQVDFELRAKILSNYTPYQYVGVMYQPTQFINLAGGISYGGYNEFEGRLQATFKTHNFRFGVGTNHLVGLISNNNGYGKSAYFSTAFWF